jgi:hypothetical protein
VQKTLFPSGFSQVRVGISTQSYSNFGLDGDPMAGLCLPAFEQALRTAAGRSVDDHRRMIGDLWARFSDVARCESRA